MKKLTREQVIEEIIQNLYELEDETLLGDTLRDGFKGYNNYTDKELISQYKIVFETEIEIPRQSLTRAEICEKLNADFDSNHNHESFPSTYEHYTDRELANEFYRTFHYRISFTK